MNERGGKTHTHTTTTTTTTTRTYVNCSVGVFVHIVKGTDKFSHWAQVVVVAQFHVNHFIGQEGTCHTSSVTQHVQL
jgi:hypothetical protein